MAFCDAYAPAVQDHVFERDTLDPPIVMNLVEGCDMLPCGVMRHDILRGSCRGSQSSTPSA